MLSDQIMDEKPPFYQVGKTNKPDVWLLPNFTWEIAADQLTRSPTYQLSIDSMKEEFGQRAQGLSLRFPRFVRRRDDKNIPKDKQITLKD